MTDEKELVALRKVLFGVTDADPEEDTIFDAANALIEKVETLNRRVAELEAQVDPDPGGKTYEEMDRDDLVLKLRQALARRAGKNGGKGSMDYTDVLAVFDEHPSDAYAYKLMKHAGKADGFEYEERSKGTNRIKVDTAAVNDERVFYTVNKAESKEAPA